MFFDQFKVPTIKFGKCFLEFMIPIALQKHEFSANFWSFAVRFIPLKGFGTVFPIQTHGQSNLTLLNMSQGQPSVIIYTNFVELESPMLHTTVQDQRTFSSGEESF